MSDGQQLDQVDLLSQVFEKLGSFLGEPVKIIF